MMRALRIYEIKKSYTGRLSTMGVGSGVSLFGKNLIDHIDPNGSLKRLPLDTFISSISYVIGKKFSNDMLHTIEDMVAPEDKITMVSTHNVMGMANNKDISAFYNVINTVGWTPVGPSTFRVTTDNREKTVSANIKYERTRRIGRLTFLVVIGRWSDYGDEMTVHSTDHYDFIMYSE